MHLHWFEIPNTIFDNKIRSEYHKKVRENKRNEREDRDKRVQNNYELFNYEQKTFVIDSLTDW